MSDGSLEVIPAKRPALKDFDVWEKIEIGRGALAPHKSDTLSSQELGMRVNILSK